MQIGIITPTKYLEEFATKSRYHLVLAHMVEGNSTYRDFYKSMSERGDFITLDNSSYEMGDDIYTANDLIELAHLVGAQEVMAPEEYPDGEATVKKVEAFMKGFTDKKLSVFATIHGKDFADAYVCFHKCVGLGVDTIGFSCRLDFRIFEQPYNEHDGDSLQRSNVRMAFIRQVYHRAMGMKVCYHLLGLNHPWELLFYRGMNLIRSHDSSGPFQAGYLGSSFKDPNYKKPTLGLDFDMISHLGEREKRNINNNIKFIMELGNDNQSSDSA